MIAVSLVTGWLIALGSITASGAPAVANPIAQVASSREEAALLAVTVDAEGGVRPKVMDCRILGDKGHAFGGYQLHPQHFRGHTVVEFCHDPKLQAELALRALSHGKTVRTRIAAFMGRRENDAEVTRRLRRFDRLMKEAQHVDS